MSKISQLVSYKAWTSLQVFLPTGSTVFTKTVLTCCINNAGPSQAKESCSFSSKVFYQTYQNNVNIQETVSLGIKECYPLFRETWKKFQKLVHAAPPQLVSKLCVKIRVAVALQPVHGSLTLLLPNGSLTLLLPSSPPSKWGLALASYQGTARRGSKAAHLPQLARKGIAGPTGTAS